MRVLAQFVPGEKVRQRHYGAAADHREREPGHDLDQAVCQFQEKRSLKEQREPPLGQGPPPQVMQKIVKSWRFILSWSWTGIATQIADRPACCPPRKHPP